MRLAQWLFLVASVSGLYFGSIALWRGDWIWAASFFVLAIGAAILSAPNVWRGAKP